MTQERAASGDEGPSRKQGKLQRKRKREAAAAATAPAAAPPDSGASPVLADEATAAGERSAVAVASVKTVTCQHLTRPQDSGIRCSAAAVGLCVSA